MAWDETLYFDYQWDFEGWTRELFQKVERNTLRSLKTVLRHRGVYTGNLRARVVDSLFNLRGGENPPEWDPVEFRAARVDKRSEAYQRQQNAHQAAPVDRQQLQLQLQSQSLPHSQSQPQTQPQPQSHTEPELQRLPQDEQQRDRQGEQYGLPHTSSALEASQPPSQDARTATPTVTSEPREVTTPLTQAALLPPLLETLCSRTPHTPDLKQTLYMPQLTPQYDYRDLATITDSADYSMDRALATNLVWPLEFTQATQLRKRDRLPRARHKPKLYRRFRHSAVMRLVKLLRIATKALKRGRLRKLQSFATTVSSTTLRQAFKALNKPHEQGSARLPVLSSSLRCILQVQNHLWSDPDAPRASHEPPDAKEVAVPVAAQPRKRGRPPRSKNKREAHAYITKKEEDDLELAIKLRNDGVITTPGAPFEASDDQEISDLAGRGVFKFERYNDRLHNGIRIFKSRLVREIKGKTTKPYEKSRLVIQGYQDHGKEAISTQSPTIQRCSQRLIMSLAPVLVQHGMSVELRDITQAYPQAQTTLKRTILAHLPTELVHRYPEGTLLHVIKPLYGIAEAGVHWWTTYHGHHCKELDMSTSTYDPCLLITNSDANVFGIVGMQTDDTLMLGTPAFSSLEEKKVLVGV
jgi:hypothetical protein